jgi:DNA-binding transcriptional LysR family regulator
MSNTSKKIDLNLLVTLDALLKDPNVTRVANSLHLSQPSVSVQLSKLRKHIGDSLFLPGAGGMRPTARAEMMREPLSAALNMLNQAISDNFTFIPESSERVWKVIASDYCEMILLLPMIKKLRTIAPLMKLSVLHSPSSQLSSAKHQGDIDLIFHIKEEAPQGLRYHKLFTEHYVLVGRKSNPLLHTSLDIKQFSSLSFVIVSPDGGGFWTAADDMLDRLKLKRNIVISVPHFMFALSTIKTTDLVALLPSRLIQDDPDLCSIEPPIEIPNFDMYMLWHERLHRDIEHEWLRNLILQSM